MDWEEFSVLSIDQNNPRMVKQMIDEYVDSSITVLAWAKKNAGAVKEFVRNPKYDDHSDRELAPIVKDWAKSMGFDFEVVGFDF